MCVILSVRVPFYIGPSIHLNLLHKQSLQPTFMKLGVGVKLSQKQISYQGVCQCLQLSRDDKSESQLTF